MDKTNITPILYSLPVVQTMTLPARAEILPKIESGEQEYIDFRARVYGTGRVRNPVQFLDADLEAFALSFEGKPFLRDHEQEEIEAREGTILSSRLDGDEIVQDIRLTTRRGMADYIEGRIDRFSIGWMSDSRLCSICGVDYIGGGCPHIAGRMYDTPMGSKMCLIVFINPVGIETSAVNVPAVDGTYIESQLQKMTLLKTADDGQAPSEADKPTTPEMPAQARAYLLAVESRKLFLYPSEANMNVREMIATRTQKLESAEALAKLADSESRDFTDEERTQFGQLMQECDELAAKVNQINGEREKLRTALEAKLNAPAQAEAEKPEAAEKSNALKRSEFDALSVREQAAFVKNGGKIQD